MNESYQIQRHDYQDDTWVTVRDMIFLCEVSRDRHLVEGHDHAAETMDNLCCALELLL